MIYDRQIIGPMMNGTFGDEIYPNFKNIYGKLSDHEKPSEVIEGIAPIIDIELYNSNYGELLYNLAFIVIQHELELKGYYNTPICLDRFFKQNPNVNGYLIEQILYALANTSISTELNQRFSQDEMLVSSSLVASSNGTIGSGVVESFAWSIYGRFEDMPESIAVRLVDLVMYTTKFVSPKFFVKLPAEELSRIYSENYDLIKVAIELLNPDSQAAYYIRFAKDCINLENPIRDKNLLYELMYRIVYFDNVSNNKELIKKEIINIEDFKNFLKTKGDLGDSIIRRIDKYMFGIPYPTAKTDVFDMYEESKIADLFKSFLLRS